MNAEELERTLETLTLVQFATYLAYIEYPSDLVRPGTLPTYRQISSFLRLPQYIVAYEINNITRKGISFEKIKELRREIEEEREKTPTERAFQEERGNLGSIEHIVYRELKKYSESDILRARETIAQYLHLRPYIVEKIFSRLRRKGLLEERKKGTKPIIEEIADHIPDDAILEERKMKIAPEDERLYDLLKNHPEKSYAEIARELGFAYTRITNKIKEYRKAGLLEKRKRGRKSIDGIVDKTKSEHTSYAERDARVLEYARQGKTSTAIGKIEGLSRERVRQIIEKTGYTSVVDEARQRASEDKKNLPAEYQRIVDTVQQYYFNRLIEERGLPHALAWRYITYHGRGGNYTIEQLEKVIELRLQGNGYYLCVKGAGIATETKQIRTVTPKFAKILRISLDDVYTKKGEVNKYDTNASC